MVFISKTAPGPSQIGDVGGPQGLNDIIPDPLLIGYFRILIHPESSINASPKMFREMSVYMPADGFLAQIGINN